MLEWLFKKLVCFEKNSSLTHCSCLSSAAVLQGREFSNSRHHSNPHCGVTEKRAEEESGRGWCGRVTGQQTGELLVLLMLHPVGGREVLVVKLVMGMRGRRATAQNVFDQKRGSARWCPVLTWLGLLLLASRLHLSLLRKYLIFDPSKLPSSTLT